MNKKYNFEEFVEIIQTLLGENGCPWDRKQTHKTLRQSMIEECYEVVEAIDNDDSENLCEELGDVLLQVVFHSQLAENENLFELSDVIDAISKKMINRHPHIFETDKVETDKVETWEEIKKKEKGYTSNTEIIRLVPKCLPSLVRASKVQTKASNIGFDFTDFNEALGKVYEEFDELKEAYNLQDSKQIEEEFGDLLFSIVNISRFLKVNAEFALTKSIEKFINRFEYIENEVLSQNKSIEGISITELNRLWDEAKKSI